MRSEAKMLEGQGMSLDEVVDKLHTDEKYAAVASKYIKDAIKDLFPRAVPDASRNSHFYQR